MKIAIFGGGGFIGSHLVEHLVLNEKIKVIAADIDSSKISPDCPKKVKNYNFIHLDIFKSNDELKNIIKDSDAVINLIAYAMPSLYLEKPIDVVNLNFNGNMKIVQQCIEQNKWLIQFSSCEIYGLLDGRRGVFSEDSSLLVLGPINKNRWIYSCAKQLLERIIFAHGEENNLDYTIIRPFNFIGPKMDFLVKSREEGIPRVFANFMSSLLYKTPMYVVDGGKNRRTFIYIEDAVNAIVLIIKNREIFENEIVNIGNPKNEISMRNLAYLMQGIYKKNIKNEIIPEIISIDGEKYYGSGYQDSERRIPDIKKLTKVGWKPYYNLFETFKNSMEYYISRRLKNEI